MDYYPYYPYYDNGSYGLPRKTGSLIAKQLPKDGNRSWKVITQPTIEPITADDVKIFGRIDTSIEDPLIESWIQAVRLATEEYLGRGLIKQTIQTKMDFWPGDIVYLPRPPLISVDIVAALDEDGTETEYSSDNYYLITEAEPGKLIIKRDVSWPINTDRDYGSFVIRSNHGYGYNSDDVPMSIRNGMKLWVAVVYETRVLDPKNPPPETKGMLDIYKTPEVMIR